VRAFFLTQTPITQSQWRAVALWEMVERDLKPDPSTFKGSNRPVDQVSWHEATEFCRRLIQRTRKRYGLPSEAQWEYACRAGTTTPFHFGAMLTPELANYDGNSTYGGGPKGTFRKQTTDVASFPANAWGVQDMHGNVWGWCEEHWHNNYIGSPPDGRPWIERNAPFDKPRLLRGGSWCLPPVNCRSAYRDATPPPATSASVSVFASAASSRTNILPRSPSTLSFFPCSSGTGSAGPSPMLAHVQRCLAGTAAPAVGRLDVIRQRCASRSTSGRWFSYPRGLRCQPGHGGVPQPAIP
jgi:hypothetical protein